jgi:ATP-dependent DNA helicase PIF1
MASIIDTEQDIIEHVLGGNRNILISGPGGTGKSFLIKKIVSLNGTNDFTMKKIAVTAATGVAAINVNGTTCHRFFGCGIARGSMDQIIGTVQRNKDAVFRIKTTNVLIIDEMSMIGGDLFTKFDKIAKFFRKNNEPFGGMQIVAVADFLQLCPINDTWVFESDIWKILDFKPFILSEPKRFSDTLFFETLMRIRNGKMSIKDQQSIKGRINAYNEYCKKSENDNELTIKPTILYSLKVNVENLNQEELNKLENKPKKFVSVDSCKPKVANVTIDYFIPLLDELAPKELLLAIGAQVMITWNLSVESGICNGTRGVIVGFDSDANTVTLKLCNNQEITIEQMPFVVEDNQGMATRKQFPLIVAYAITTHKSQGSTLDFVIVDLGPSIFAPGQAYVALSRARNWESILISNYSRSSIKADPKALMYMQSIEPKAQRG